MREKVFAVVVTHNRKLLLRECLQAVMAQRFAPDQVILVNNATPDDSVQMVEQEFPGVRILNLSENTGAAGGFHYGLKEAVEEGADWVWLMDDDCIAKPDTLEKLMAALEQIRAFSPDPNLLVSRSVWTDGRLHPLNMPWADPRRLRLLWTALGYGYLLIRWGAYASMLVRAQAVRELGLPIKEYFLWNDDVEYSGRLLRRGTGYWVFDSVFVHKTSTPKPPAYATADRYFLQVRNRIWMLRTNSWGPLGKVIWGLHLAAEACHFVWLNRWHGLGVLQRGWAAGIKPIPSGDDSPGTVKGDPPDPAGP